MPTLLHLDCSSQRTLRSVSRQITAAGVEAWRSQHPHGRVIYRDLTKTPLVSIGQDWIDGKDLTNASRTEEQGFALAQSDQLVDELLSADILILGAPMYNFTLPSVLKHWLDLVIRSERTIRFTSEGPKGLLAARTAVVVIASGGDYSEGSAAHAVDFETPYLNFILRSLGVQNLSILHAFSTGRIDRAEISIAQFLKPWCEQMVQLVSNADEGAHVSNTKEQRVE